MGRAADSLLDDALKLPEKERAHVAKELIASLDRERDEGVEEAWLSEVEKRRAAVARGEQQLIPWEKVKADIRASLKIR